MLVIITPNLLPGKYGKKWQEIASKVLDLQVMAGELKINGRKLLIANQYATCNSFAETSLYVQSEFKLKKTSADAEVSRTLKNPDVITYLQTRLNMPQSELVFTPIQEEKPLPLLRSTHKILLELLEVWDNKNEDIRGRLEAIEKYLKVTGAYKQDNEQKADKNLTVIKVPGLPDIIWKPEK